jgi:hypothetical protein
MACRASPGVGGGATGVQAPHGRCRYRRGRHRPAGHPDGDGRGAAPRFTAGNLGIGPGDDYELFAVQTLTLSRRQRLPGAQNAAARFEMIPPASIRTHAHGTPGRAPSGDRCIERADPLAQQRAEALLPLPEAARADGFAIDIGELEQERQEPKASDKGRCDARLANAITYSNCGSRRPDGR